MKTFASLAVLALLGETNAITLTYPSPRRLDVTTL